jgi:protoheme IX farnesyltransferase
VRVVDIGWKERVSQYIALAKPRIAIMVMISVGVGFILGEQKNADWLLLLNVLCGVGLTALASNALNQFLEYETDGMMTRTSQRPLPTGKLTLTEAGWMGVISGIGGGIWLYYYVNPLTAYLSLSTMFLYVGVYTPLKRLTPMCMAIGAIPGAMPPLLGYTGITGHVDAMGWALFTWLLVWQFPHFLAIAWMYNEQYRAAGLKMLPANAESTNTVGNVAVFFAIMMIPASIFPVMAGGVGFECGILGSIMAMVYVGYSWKFRANPTRQTARALMLYSVMYLPAQLLIMSLSHQRLIHWF